VHAAARTGYRSTFSSPRSIARARRFACRARPTLTTQHNSVPSVLALNLRHNGVLHERLVLLKASTERAPRVVESARVTVEELSAGIRWVELRFGFAENPMCRQALLVHLAECDPATALVLSRPGSAGPLSAARAAIVAGKRKKARSSRLGAGLVGAG
jgi:hypothetical protein